MTPYEIWQLEKYGNYIPEQDTDDSDAEDFDSLCDGDWIAYQTHELELNHKSVQSLSNL